MSDKIERPTDWFALCDMSYGIGASEDQAIQTALREAGRFQESGPVEIEVWHLYADSWNHHSPEGPVEAEEINYRTYLMPAPRANRVSKMASNLEIAVDRALGDSEVVSDA